MTELALANAARRLREAPPAGFPGRPGRPRTRPPKPDAGHTPGTQGPGAPVVARLSGGTPVISSGVPGPRLLDVRQTATYLALSPWAIRSLDAAGALSPARVRVPLPGGRELRKVLYDRQALDTLVNRWSRPA